jgi:hypothetical protein
MEFVISPHMGHAYTGRRLLAAGSPFARAGGLAEPSITFLSDLVGMGGLRGGIRLRYVLGVRWWVEGNSKTE